MTPYDLLAAFETLAEAPDGIARLRELVLQLAVRGKLMPQDPNDEPACLLLERIAAEKARLVKEGKIPKAKPLPLVDEDEVPFEIPEGWTWTRLGSLVSKLGAGSTPLGGAEVYVAVGVKFIRSQNVWNDGLRLDGIAFINEATHQRMAGTHVSAGDLLFNITGASIGRCAVVPDSFDTGNVSQHVAIVRPVYSTTRRYLHVALTSDLVQGMVTRTQVGISREGLSVGRLGQFPLPLPPLPEQHRIVAKVDALMALLDRLDAARSERETTRAALRDATRAALRDAPDAEAVDAAWTRIAERMDDLFTDPADVTPLRQTILQLAVRGKLVPQDPSDEPACLLLERIAAEKARLVKEGRIRRENPLQPVDENEVPFEVLARWVYVRIDEVCDIVSGVTKGRQLDG